MVNRGVLALSASVTVLTVMFSGCIEDQGAGPAGAVDETVTTASDMLFDASGCYEGGFVAAYKGLGTLSGGWQQADIWHEIGEPLRDGIGLPNPPGTELSGNWHQGISCDTVTYNGETYEDFKFGYVGDAIEPPAFDVGGADLHFIVSALGMKESAAYTDFREASKAGISATTDVRIDYLAGDLTMPRFATYVIFATHDNGEYISYSEMGPYREVEPRTIRIWWTVPTTGEPSPLGSHHVDVEEGLKWHPVYFDITTQGGQQWTTPQVDSVEVACHMGVDDHGPQGGACQPTQTVIYEHKALTFEYGGILKDIVLDEFWHH